MTDAFDNQPEYPSESLRFLEAFNQIAATVHMDSVKRGFWPDASGDLENVSEVIALIHSEASEALEAMRRGNPPDDKIPEFSGLEVEFADIIIRVMDAAAAWDLNLASAITAKIVYNRTRPHKHGKAF